MRNFRLALSSVAACLALALPVPGLAEIVAVPFSLTRDQSTSFSIFMPDYAGTYRYSATGTGKVILAIKRCGPATGDAARDSHRGLWELGKTGAYSSTPSAPDLGCAYGFFVECRAPLCQGHVVFDVDRVPASVLTAPGGATGPGQPEAPPPPPAPPPQPVSPPVSGAGGVVPGGDAGGQNASAAPVPYPCRIAGFVARGDYDAFVFDFPGGVFRARSEPGLDLVADLIRASDGMMLARAGDATPQFHIEGDLGPGRYILMLRVMRHAGEGRYGVQLGLPGSCLVQDTR